MWCELGKIIKLNENWRANNKEPGNFKWNDKFILDRFSSMGMSESWRPYRPQAKHIVMVNRMGPRGRSQKPDQLRPDNDEDFSAHQQMYTNVRPLAGDTAGTKRSLVTMLHTEAVMLP